jgi:hypothetical protein
MITITTIMGFFFISSILLGVVFLVPRQGDQYKGNYTTYAKLMEHNKKKAQDHKDMWIDETITRYIRRKEGGSNG